MDWFSPIDLYCERTAAGFWNEPLNAISNISFILAAMWAYAEAKSRNMLDPVLSGLIILAGLAGVGSFLFHTFANAWSELADVIPVWSFVVCYVVVAIRRLGGASRAKTGRIAFIGVFVAGIVVWMMTSGVVTEGGGEAAGDDGLNGSSQYAPALIALWVFAIISLWRKHPARKWVVMAAIVFSVSLVFRTIDLWICSYISFGTHWLWHLLNGLMTGLLLQAMVRYGETE